MEKAGVSRRAFLSAAVAGTVSASTPSAEACPEDFAGSSSLARTPAWEAIELERGRHLFVDDFLVADSRNLKWSLHHPRKLDRPILLGVGSANDNFQPFLTVLRDQRRGVFRMWYNTRKIVRGGHTYVSYTESRDGVHWDTPYKELFEIFGFGCCVTDQGTEDSDPSQRYKMIYWGRRRDDSVCKDGGAGLRVALSPDGLSWTQYRGNPVTPDLWKDSAQCDPGKQGNIEWRNYPADCVHATWDRIRKIYVAYVKSWSWPPHEFGDYMSPTGSGMGRRLESIMVSPDFIHWSTPVRCFVPEPDDLRSIEFGYTFRAKPRGNQMLLLSSILDQGFSTAKGNGIGYTVLSTTNDLFHCRRMRQVWLDREANDDQARDHAIAWIGDMVTVGEEEYIYYAGYQWGHKNFTDRTINMARLRKDGFVSRDAATACGSLVTPLVRFNAARMTANARVRGELRVRILDETGRSVPGFSKGDVAPIRGDSTAHTVNGRAGLSELARRPVRLEFALRDGELYGFELLEH